MNLSASLVRLQKALGGRAATVSDALLQRALTHRSAGKDNYERLEFLGDALVNALCAEWLFSVQPLASEGELTRTRANLVDEAALARFAQQLALSDALIMGGGELKSGGYRRESILSDAFEALCAAIYLSAQAGRQGSSHPDPAQPEPLNALRIFLTPFFEHAFAEAHERASAKDAKTQLQEWLQDRALGLPRYQLLASTGKEHDPSFEVQASAIKRSGAEAEALGHGSSVKRAEQAAARALLAALQA